MKKIRNFCALAVILLSQQSLAWGPLGHKTTALIAESYLTPKARLAVEEILNGQRLVDVVNWADSLRGMQEFSHTLPYHYQNMPNTDNIRRTNKVLYATTLKSIKSTKGYTAGVIEALVASEETLTSRNLSLKEKELALKFFSHFIGDLHQPLHTGRLADRGGNFVRLQWGTSETNLHRLWDSDLIYDRMKKLKVPQGQDYAIFYGNYLVKKYKNINYAQEYLEDIGLMYGESVALQQIAYDPLYKEDQAQYYEMSISKVDIRVYLAGRRMAALLNKYFDSYEPQSANAQLVKTIEKMFGPLNKLISLEPRGN